MANKKTKKQEREEMEEILEKLKNPKWHLKNFAIGLGVFSSIIGISEIYDRL